MSDIKLYTREDLAKMFQVHVNTIDLWRKQGVIKGVKVNRAVRFTEEDVKALIENNKNGPNEK